jgi:hypothetical protein
MKNGLNQQKGPPPRRDVLWVERVRGGEKFTARVYSPSMWGVWTHYVKGFSQPCYENSELCCGGHLESNMRWYGYVHAYSFKRQRAVIIQLTAGAAREWLEQLAEGTVLRGQQIEVSRTAADKGRVHVQVQQYQTVAADAIPPHIDPYRSLLAMWKVPPIEELLNRRLVSKPPDIPEGDFTS